MEIKDLVGFKKELENIVGEIDGVTVDTDDNFIMIDIRYSVTFSKLSQLKEYFGVEDLYISYYKGGVSVRVQ